MSHEMFLAEDFLSKGDSIYETIVAIARRARQIAEDQRKEMDAYLTQLGMLEDFQEDEENPLDEIMPTRSEPVLQFEKPTILALREMIADKLDVKRTVENPEIQEVERVESGLEIPGKLDLASMEEEEGREEPELPPSFPSKLSLDE